MIVDPLRDGLPKQSLEYPATYWHATAGDSPEDDGPVAGDIDVDVAIIGGGYTGLSCARTLASEFGVQAVVLEAHRPAWGCSGRNGSFARPVIARLSFAEQVKLWGDAKAREVFREARDALDTVRSLIDAGGFVCDRQPDGFLKVAHSKKMVSALLAEQRLLKDVYGYDTELLDAGALRERYVGQEAHAALRFSDGFGIHPVKLAFGVLRMARAAGARIHSRSPVTRWIKSGNVHLLQTPGGVVRSKRVVVATNGYTTEKLHPALRARLIPVLCNIVVTQPLNEVQRRESGLPITDIMADTRAVLNFYRCLPDGRVLLGSRGPIRENGDNLHTRQLLGTIIRKFPALRDIGAEYAWGGWVALTMDCLPHVHTLADEPTVSYSVGYNGSGVSAALHAGHRLAQQMQGGKPLVDKVSTALPRVPFPAFRRLGQRAAFAWFAMKDRG